MDIEDWWHTLDPATREALIENNGDALTPGQVEEIAHAGRTIQPDADGEFFLSDEEVDWIEATANDESPDLD